MTKKASSDDIKVALTKMFGGAEKDWKRLSKKNEGGETVREFENAVLDCRITVIEDADGDLRAVTSAEESRRLVEKTLAAFAKTPSAEAWPMSFALHHDSEFGVIANFRPLDDDESLPGRLPADAEYDECVVGGWTFPSLPDAPAKVAQDLVRRGFTWNRNLQETLDGTLTAEISAALNPPKPQAGGGQGPKP